MWALNNWSDNSHSHITKAHCYLVPADRAVLVTNWPKAHKHTSLCVLSEHSVKVGLFKPCPMQLLTPYSARSRGALMTKKTKSFWELKKRRVADRPSIQYQLSVIPFSRHSPVFPSPEVGTQSDRIIKFLRQLRSKTKVGFQPKFCDILAICYSARRKTPTTVTWSTLKTEVPLTMKNPNKIHTQDGISH